MRVWVKEVFYRTARGAALAMLERAVCRKNALVYCLGNHMILRSLTLCMKGVAVVALKILLVVVEVEWYG